MNEAPRGKGRPTITSRFSYLLNDRQAEQRTSVIVTLEAGDNPPGAEIYSAVWAIDGKAKVKATGARLEQALMRLSVLVEQHRRDRRHA